MSKNWVDIKRNDILESAQFQSEVGGPYFRDIFKVSSDTQIVCRTWLVYPTALTKA